LCRGDGVGDREQLGIVSEQLDHLAVERRFGFR
jgi:hypothetical protein